MSLCLVLEESRRNRTLDKKSVLLQKPCIIYKNKYQVHYGKKQSGLCICSLLLRILVFNSDPLFCEVP